MSQDSPWYIFVFLELFSYTKLSYGRLALFVFHLMIFETE